MDSEVDPSSRRASIRSTSVTPRVTPSRTAVLNPAASNVNLYEPTGRLGTRYWPTSFVTVSTLRFVLVCTTAIFTFGTADPVGSTTEPTKVPRSCAKALTHSSAAMTENKAVFICPNLFSTFAGSARRQHDQKPICVHYF